MIVERLFSWDYEMETERDEEAKKQISMGSLCVRTDHDWAYDAYSLEAYRPVHRRPAFRGGYYEEYCIDEHFGVTEAEAYALIADYLKSGETIRFDYDNRSEHLIVFRFRPILEG